MCFLFEVKLFLGSISEKKVQNSLIRGAMRQALAGGGDLKEFLDT
jgi:hypothetical protein